jgi:carbonic anhydrase
VQLDHLRSHPSVAEKLSAGQLKLHGWVYHIATGEVTAYDAERRAFAPL